MNIDYRHRIGDLEAQSCDIHLIHDGPNETIEISQWGNDNSYRWVIANFERGEEGFWLKFVGDRPFRNDVNWLNFGKLAREGQKILDDFFKEMKNDDFV